MPRLYSSSWHPLKWNIHDIIIWILHSFLNSYITRQYLTTRYSYNKIYSTAQMYALNSNRLPLTTRYHRYTLPPRRLLGTGLYTHTTHAHGVTRSTTARRPTWSRKLSCYIQDEHLRCQEHAGTKDARRRGERERERTLLARCSRWLDEPSSLLSLHGWTVTFCPRLSPDQHTCRHVCAPRW